MTNGAKAVAAIKAWMKSNGRRPVWSELEQIIDTALPAPKKRRRLTQEEWLEKQRKDPLNVGIDIDVELALAQKWCRDNTRNCTERFFENWLKKAERKILTGQKQPTEIPPIPGWELYIEERMAQGLWRSAKPTLWSDLTGQQRKEIHGVSHRIRQLKEFADGNESAWRQHLQDLRKQTA